MGDRIKITYRIMTMLVIVSLFFQTMGPLIQAQEGVVTPPVDPTPAPAVKPTVQPNSEEQAPDEDPVPTGVMELPTATPEPTTTSDPTPTEIQPNPNEITPTETLSEVVLSGTVTPTASSSPTPSVPTTDIDDTVSSQASTGSNQSNGGGGGETTIETGGANAAGQQANLAGNEQVDVEATGTVMADSGNNQADNNRSIVTTISTGDAIAFINLVNLLNTQLIDSEVKVYFINLSNTSEVSANLNEVWKKMLTEGTPEATPINPDDVNNVLNVTNGSADLNTNVNVSANSGGNQINNGGGIAIIKAGNATALANVINLINTNLISSKYLIGTINITGDYQGDLVLPRLEMFFRDQSPGNAALVTQAMGDLSMNNQVSALANSGNNSGNSTITGTIATGDAGSYANTFVEAGIDRFYEGSFFLMVNNLGNWNGQIYGWNDPQSVSVLNGYQNILYHAFNYQISSNGLYEMINFQNGDVNAVNNISVSANTGNNQANGSYQSDIMTGTSLAMANLFNFANVNYYQSLRFFGLINILGNWKGNIVFAYPDVTINMATDQEENKTGRANITLSVKNVGYDEANNVRVQLDLPDGISLTDNSVQGTINNDEYVFNMGKMAIGEKKELILGIKINPAEANSKTVLSRMISKVWAAENSKSVEMMIRGKVVTSDPESNSQNNTSAVNVVYQYQSQEEKETDLQDKIQPADNGQEGQAVNPALEIRTKNNVGDFVYPSDVVTFEVEVNNRSTVPVSEAKLYHMIVGGNDEILTNTVINIGSIRAGATGKITFGIPLPAEAKSGRYESITTVRGLSPSGETAESNQSRTFFEIESRAAGMVSVQTDQTDGAAQGRVLGLASYISGPVFPDNANSLWPYLILFLCSAIWLRINLAQVIHALNEKKSIDLRPTTYALMGVMLLLFTMSTRELFRTKELRKLKFNFQQTQVQINKIVGTDGNK